MANIDDGVRRFIQIKSFPQIKLTHDENDSNCSICICDFNKNETILILPCVVSSIFGSITLSKVINIFHL